MRKSRRGLSTYSDGLAQAKVLDESDVFLVWMIQAGIHSEDIAEHAQFPIFGPKTLAAVVGCHGIGGVVGETSPGVPESGE